MIRLFHIIAESDNGTMESCDCIDQTPLFTTYCYSCLLINENVPSKS